MKQACLFESMKTPLIAGLSQLPLVSSLVAKAALCSFTFCCPCAVLQLIKKESALMWTHAELVSCCLSKKVMSVSKG